MAEIVKDEVARPVSAAKAARALGVSRPFLLKLARAGEIPALFLGKNVIRFDLPTIVSRVQRGGDLVARN